MFRTTKKFLEVFGLNSLNELPNVNDEPETQTKELEINYET